VRRLTRKAAYEGQQQYFVTICTRLRRSVFTDPVLVEVCRTQILRAAEGTGFRIVAYCFMSDHLHILVAGGSSSDLRELVKRAKQMSSYHAGRKGHPHIWQSGYYDRVIRQDEDVRRYARYILENPVRSGLVAAPSDYPYGWTEIPP
jgi:putative transposase